VNCNNDFIRAKFIEKSFIYLPSLKTMIRLAISYTFFLLFTAQFFWSFMNVHHSSMNGEQSNGQRAVFHKTIDRSDQSDRYETLEKITGRSI
jgi:hypothetical protein